MVRKRCDYEVTFQSEVLVISVVVACLVVTATLVCTILALGDCRGAKDESRRVQAFLMNSNRTLTVDRSTVLAKDLYQVVQSALDRGGLYDWKLVGPVYVRGESDWSLVFEAP